MRVAVLCVPEGVGVEAEAEAFTFALPNEMEIGLDMVGASVEKEHWGYRRLWICVKECHVHLLSRRGQPILKWSVCLFLGPKARRPLRRLGVQPYVGDDLILKE